MKSIAICKRVANGGKLSRQRWCPEKCDEIKCNMYVDGSPLAVPELNKCSATEQKTESPKAVPREMMR